MLVNVHIAILIITGIAVLLSDHEGFRYFRGTVQTLDLVRLRTFHAIILIGLGLMLITGLILFWPLRDFLLKEPAFYVKMAFVASLVVNSFFIGQFLPFASTRPFVSLSKKERAELIVSGGISFVSWVGAILTALFLFG